MTADLQAIARDLVAVATTDDPAPADALRGALGDGVTFRGPMGDQTGPDGVLEALAATRGFVAGGNWADPRVGEGEARVGATFAPGGRLAAAELTLRVDADGRVTEILQRLTPAGPPPPVPVDLGHFAPAIDGALLNGTTVVVAYVDGDGRPHLSFRGTVQVFDDDHLALWARDAGGGLPRALPTNPHLAFWYHDPTTRTTYQFAGRGHVEDDTATRDHVFDHSPEREQLADPDRTGVAIMVEVDEVSGRGPDGAVNQRRDA